MQEVGTYLCHHQLWRGDIAWANDALVQFKAHLEQTWNSSPEGLLDYTDSLETFSLISSTISVSIASS